MKQHNLSYWEDLVERYFQAETSEQEEVQLRKFLCSSQAQDSCFDEIKAAMSLLHVIRQKKKPAMRYPLRVMAVAACLCVVAFLGWYQYRQHDISHVRIAGEEIKADASLVMERQMAEMFNNLDQSDR